MNAFLVNLIRVIPDKYYLSLLYFRYFKRILNWKSPRNFSEKLQWLKVYDRNPEYTKMVDKYAVKEYVERKIGKQYVIPTLGIWDSVDEIDYDILPNQFVLKTTHGGGGGGVVICKDKSKFNKEMARKRLLQSMNADIYKTLREWPYKNVKKRIIAEQYMEDDNGELNDYKFSCFNGYVNDVMVCIDRQLHDAKFYFFDRNWKLLPLNVRGKAASVDFTLPEPACIGEMFEIASKLSKGLPYVRVDLYAIKGKAYFGEITFYPQSGFDKNLLPEAEKFYGDLIHLPDKR
ncbi:ATP-grasp fold amidoligase family protein [Butyricimonas synergistica]|uniref:ATP-grasp fold amidoligase family protein n=1 Tax=Butyricimonas synergistica TaxID=544644 RepID=UPI0022E23016|nr:ATP-grasp fold amidoligase family protein [Butyricimonas synergistica]